MYFLPIICPPSSEHLFVSFPFWFALKFTIDLQNHFLVYFYLHTAFHSLVKSIRQKQTFSFLCSSLRIYTLHNNIIGLASINAICNLWNGIFMWLAHAHTRIQINQTIWLIPDEYIHRDLMVLHCLFWFIVITSTVYSEYWVNQWPGFCSLRVMAYFSDFSELKRNIRWWILVSLAANPQKF